VIFIYLLPRIMPRLKKKLEAELKKGTRVISYAFAIGDWQPVYLEPNEPKKNVCRILVYEMGKHQ
jgi:hypothetical protein